MSEEKRQVGDMIDSGSDARVVNNVMRHEYRVLSDEEKRQMHFLKDSGFMYHRYVGQLMEQSVSGDAKRCYALAKTKIEEAVMWAVKGLTE